MSNHHHHNSAGFFSNIFRSIFRQDQSNASGGGGSNNDTQERAADPSSRDVDMNADDSDDSRLNHAAGPTSGAPTLPRIQYNGVNDADEDNDLPPLQEVSDTEYSEDGDETMQNESIPPSSTTSNVSSHAASPAPFSVRSGQRRARVDEEDDGDHERDRRHPSQRAASRIASRLATAPTNLGQQNMHTSNSSNVSSSSNPHNRSLTNGSNTNTSTSNDADLPHSFMHSLFRDALPFANSPLPSGGNPSTSHYHIIHHHHGPLHNTHEGLGGGVPGVGLRAAGESRNIPPPPGTFSRMFSRLPPPRLGSGRNQPTTNRSQTSNSGAPSGQTTPTQGSDRHSHPHNPFSPPPTGTDNVFPGPGAGPSLVIPVPFNALPILLRAIGSAIGDNPHIGLGNPQASPEDGAERHVPTNNDGQGNGNLPPFTIFGGVGAVPGDGFFPLPPGGFNFFNHPFFSSSEERETDDTNRGRQIVDGLEEIDEGLVRRLERANQALGEEEGSGCAVCWENLLDGVEGEWGPKEGESSVTVPSTPQVAQAPINGTSSPSPPDGVKDTDSDKSKQQPRKVKIVSLPCAHIFHADCLIPWFSRPRQTTCPVCRFDLDPEGRVWERRRRRGMPMGMGGFFGVPPPMPTGTPPASAGGNDGNNNRPSNVEIFSDLMALAELSRIFGGGRGPGQQGAVPDPVPAASTAGDPQAANTEAPRQPPPPTDSTPQNPPNDTDTNPEVLNPTNANTNADGTIQSIIERMVLRMLGPAFSNATTGNNRQPRVQVMNSGPGGPIQVVMDLSGRGNLGTPPSNTGPTATQPANPVAENVPQTQQEPQSTTTTPPNTNTSGAAPGNEDDQHRGPFFTIGFDMFIGTGPPPGSPGFVPPPGFLVGHRGGMNSIPTAADSTNSNNQHRSSSHNDPPSHSQPSTPSRSSTTLHPQTPQPNTFDVLVDEPVNINDEDNTVPNLDEDGDVIMELEQVFTPISEQEREEPTSAPPQESSPSSSSSGARRSRSSSRGSGRHFPRDDSGFSFSGTATSMEDAMRQINETLFAHGGTLAMPVPIPPADAQRPTEPPSRLRPRPSTTVLPPWMSSSGSGRSESLDSSAQSRSETNRGEPGQAAHSTPLQVTPSQSSPVSSPPPVHVSSPPSPVTRSTPPTSAAQGPSQSHSPTRTQDNTLDDNTPMTSDQFLRYWNGEERPPMTLPPLPPLPQTQPSTDSQRRHTQTTRSHSSPLNEARSEEQKWAPPPAPGSTFRERVEKKEREAGFRCWDMSCGIGPSDEDPLVVVGPEQRKQVHIVKKPATAKGKGKAKEEAEPAAKEKVDDKVCEHTFHPSCLVSASRVANSMWAGESDVVEGDEVSVSCPVCRATGAVSREVWDEGVKSC